MSVVPIGHLALNRADAAAIIARGRALASPYAFGEWVSLSTEEGELVVAALNRRNDGMIFGIGKRDGWYYAFDDEGDRFAEDRLLEALFVKLASWFECPAACGRQFC